MSFLETLEGGLKHYPCFNTVLAKFELGYVSLQTRTSSESS